MQSETFGEGYGDLALLSSDGTLFYSSKCLLAYASPVFKDMFEVALPEGITSQGSNHHPSAAVTPLKLTEDAVTLDLLLRHVDPTKGPLPIHENSIVKLLNAARKYQIPAIIQWFEREVTKDDGSRRGESGEKSFIENHPILVLSIALEYEIKLLVQAAILAAVNGPSRAIPNPLAEAGTDPKPLNLINSNYFLLIHQSSESRIKRYFKLIQKISEIRWEDPDNWDAGPYPADIQCEACRTPRTKWMLEMIDAVMEQPRWDVFVSAINKHTQCGSGCDWAKKAIAVVIGDELELGLRSEEHTLPFLP